MAKHKKQEEKLEEKKEVVIVENNQLQEEDNKIEAVSIIGTGKGGLLEGKEYLYPTYNALILVNKGLAVYK